MPHLLVDRVRFVPDLQTRSWISPVGKTSKGRTALLAYSIEILDIIAGLIFVVGSFCFLPAYSRELYVFLLGCYLYIVGSVIYVVISTFAVTESVHETGYDSLESFEHMLYLVGSWIFLIGTILYWPEEADYDHIEWMKGLAPGVYFNLMSPEFEGTLLFILGSLVFVMAAFVNGLNQKQFDSAQNQLLAAITSLYMAGSLLFVMGSVAFLPELGCNEQMVTIGAVAFIVGSMFYVIGGCLSLYRTSRELENPEHLLLLEEAKAAAIADSGPRDTLTADPSATEA